MNINNKKILITGGSLGIGKATAKMLIDKGAKVIITGRNKKRLEKVAHEIGAIPVVYDISSLDQLQVKATECIEKLGGTIDVLINNAGIGAFALLGGIRKEHFIEVFQTNVFGLALFTQEILPFMKTQKQGTIINIGSTASQKGFARGSVYAASKFALRGMTQCWQAELRKDNIRVALVNPSEVTTAFNNPLRNEQEPQSNKLDANDIAHTIQSVIEMEDKGFIPEVNVWATNPF